MKQFNLEEYLRLKGGGKDPKIVTREGRPARIICTDAVNQTFPVVALVQDVTPDAVEEPLAFTPDGYYHSCKCNDLYDLFFATTKHEGWINIYSDGAKREPGDSIYETEEQAHNNGVNPIATIKIEWEE